MVSNLIGNALRGTPERVAAGLDYNVDDPMEHESSSTEPDPACRGQPSTLLLYLLNVSGRHQGIIGSVLHRPSMDSSIWHNLCHDNCGWRTYCWSICLL